MMPTTAPAPVPEHLACQRPIAIDREALPPIPKNLGLESGAEMGRKKLVERVGIEPTTPAL
jgi:hypothetical protein